jgi:hypothetical protein
MTFGYRYYHRPVKLVVGDSPRARARRTVEAIKATQTQRRLKREMYERRARRAA